MSRSEVSRMIDNIISQYGRMTKTEYPGTDKTKEEILRHIIKRGEMYNANIEDPKTKKIISTIIVVVLVLAMIVPMALKRTYVLRCGITVWKRL